ncbi:MAG: ABC transporter substrate-binding protein [Caldilineaceae bacterium]
MNKLRLLWTTLLIVTLLVAACAPTTAPAAPAQPAVASGSSSSGEHEPVTLRFWHHWGGNRVPLMEEQIKRFEEKYPWITVEMTLQPWEQRLEKILTGVAAGDPPDVTMLGRQDVPAFVEQDALMALDEWMQRDGITADMFYEAEFRGTQYNGQTWILPLPTAGALKILWINNTWLESAGFDPAQPPQTWADLEEMGKQLSIVEDGSLQKVGINVSANDFMTWLYANGGSWISDDLRTVEFNSPTGLQTLQWMVDYTNNINGGIEEVNAFYAQTGEWENGPFYNDFEAMQINGSWEFFKIKDFAPTLVDNMTIAAIPHGPNGESHGIAYGGWGYVIPRNAPHPEEAWLLTSWLTTEMDGACWFLQEQQRPSPLKACNEDPASAEGNQYWDQIIDVMSQDVWVPISPVQPQVEQILAQMTEEAYFGVRTPEEAINWAAEEIQGLLDEFWAGK